MRQELYKTSDSLGTQNSVDRCSHNYIRSKCFYCWTENIVNNLKARIDGLAKNMETAYIRLSDLERPNHDILLLKSRIDALEKIFSELPTATRVGQVAHRCPVCEGKSKIMYQLPAGGYYEEACKSCEGKGIVWG
jgi:hypothetical protein